MRDVIDLPAGDQLLTAVRRYIQKRAGRYRARYLDGRTQELTCRPRIH